MLQVTGPILEPETPLIEVLKATTGSHFCSQGTRETPVRFMKALAEMCHGRTEDPKKHLKMFESDNNQMVVVSNVEYFSLCEHHLLPFFGRALVGYIPQGRVIGLSKIPRIVSCFANQMQIQEGLTEQIADFLYRELRPLGVGVCLEGQHLCMMARGAKQADAIMHTTALRGIFLDDPSVKQEFLSYR
jgi:GTP cyclohydrolase I